MLPLHFKIAFYFIATTLLNVKLIKNNEIIYILPRPALRHNHAFYRLLENNTTCFCSSASIASALCKGGIGGYSLVSEANP
jgi:hypothetical protein